MEALRSAGLAETATAALEAAAASPLAAVLTRPAGTNTSRSTTGDCANSGAHSITTEYWFMSAYMVATLRWPKALYSALLMALVVTPSCAARSRSMSMKVSTPFSVWSSSTSVRRASCFICSDRRCTHCFRSAWLSAFSVNW